MQLAAYQRWVEPFYLELMNANFLRLDRDGRHRFADSFKAIMCELDDATLEAMLYESWRPAKVAAWIIGLRHLTYFVDVVGSELLRGPAYSEHLCISLTLLAVPDGANYLEQYVGRYLAPDASDFQSDMLAAGWAMAGLVRAKDWITSPDPQYDFKKSRAGPADPAGGVPPRVGPRVRRRGVVEPPRPAADARVDGPATAPLRLAGKEAGEGRPGPQGGGLLRPATAFRRDTDGMMLRFVAGRPVSHVTTRSS